MSSANKEDLEKKLSRSELKLKHYAEKLNKSEEEFADLRVEFTVQAKEFNEIQRGLLEEIDRLNSKLSEYESNTGEPVVVEGEVVDNVQEEDDSTN